MRWQLHVRCRIRQTCKRSYVTGATPEPPFCFAACACVLPHFLLHTLTSLYSPIHSLDPAMAPNLIPSSPLLPTVFACADTRCGRGKRERLGPGATRPLFRTCAGGQKSPARACPRMLAILRCCSSHIFAWLQKVWFCTPCITLHHFASNRSRHR